MVISLNNKEEIGTYYIIVISVCFFFDYIFLISIPENPY